MVNIVNFFSYIFTLCGVLLAFASLAADFFSGHPGFGPLQILGLVGGLTLALTGVASSKASARLWLKRLILSKGGLVAISVVFSMVLVEVALRMWEEPTDEAAQFYGERAQLSKLVPDEILRFRLPSNVFGHDSSGFRNKTVPSHSDIVAIGDSWTWGVNAGRNQTWPQQLSRLSGKTVYSMALGGYGPAQYWALSKRALKMTPRTIVIGLYTGNDMVDATNIVYRLDAYAGFRNPEFSLIKGIDTVEKEVSAMQRQSKEWISRYMAQQARKELSGWTSLLLNYTATARLLFWAGYWPSGSLETLAFSATKAWAEHSPEHAIVVEGGSLKTVLRPMLRLAAVDGRYPNAREGLEVTKRIFLRLKVLVEGGGAELVVLLLPSKELAYMDIVRQWAKPANDTYEQAVAFEGMIRSQLLSFLGKEAIAVVDLLPGFRAALARDEAIFPQDGDTHPSPSGYKLIAERLYEKLRTLKTDNR